MRELELTKTRRGTEGYNYDETVKKTRDGNKLMTLVLHYGANPSRETAICEQESSPWPVEML